MSNENTNVLTRGNGSTNITSERISWWSTLLGTAAFVGAQIGVRLLALALGVLVVLGIGRGTGPLLMIAVVYEVLNIEVRRWWPPEIQMRGRLLKKKRRTHVKIMAALAVLLTVAALFQLWPALWWEVGDGRLWVALKNRSFSLGPFWLWVRLLLIVGIPWACTRGFVNFDWAMDIETRWPKAREVGFGQADIESPAVRDPRRAMRHLIRPGGNSSLVEITTGSIQEAHPPDTSASMKVGGV